MHIRRSLAVVLGLAAVAVTTLVTATPATAARTADSAAMESLGASQYIVNRHSNKCLQPVGDFANALIVQRTCNTGLRQQWRAVDRGNGFAWYVNVSSGLCLDLVSNSEDEVGNGTLVQQFFCSAEYTSELWRREASSDPLHLLLASWIRGCVDVRNRSTLDTAVIQVYACKFAEPAQQFRFVDAF
jgi:hypothetical protein